MIKKCKKCKVPPYAISVRINSLEIWEKITEVQNVWEEKDYEKDEEACDETQETPEDERIALRFRKK